MKGWLIIFSINLFFLLLGAGDALQIQCYQCEEMKHNDCSTPEYIVNCTVNVQDMCQKEVLVKPDGELSTVALTGSLSLLFIPNDTVPAAEKPERFQSEVVEGWGHGPRSKWLVFGEQIWIYVHIQQQSPQRYFGADTDLDLGISLAEVQVLKVSYNPWSDPGAESVKIHSRGCKCPARVGQEYPSSCLSVGERWLSGNQRRRSEATRPASIKLDLIAIQMRVGIN